MEVQEWKAGSVGFSNDDCLNFLLGVNMHKTVIKFLVTGGLATLLQYAVLWIGVDVFELPAAVASGVGYLMGSVLSYLLNYHYTFSSTQSHAGAVSRFYLMVLLGWLINIAVVGLLADWLGWSKWVAQVMATAIVLVWNFCSSRYWVFKSV